MSSIAGKHVLFLLENLPLPNNRRVWVKAVELQKAGCHVSAISITGPGAERREEILEGVQIHRYPAPGETNSALSFVREYIYCALHSILLAAQVALREKVDVLHLCNPPDVLWPVALLLRLTGTRCVLDHSDPFPEMYIARFRRKGLVFRALTFLEAASFRVADVILTTSEAQYQIILTRGRVPRERVVKFIGGTTPSLPDLPAEEPGLRRGKKFLLCYLGVLNPQDGAESLIELARILFHERRRRDFLLAVLGAGDSLNDLQQRTREWKLEECVQFTGWAGIDIIRRYLSTADLCLDCQPRNVYSDSITLLKVFDYMNFGRPILMAPLTETAKVVGGGGLFIPADSLPEFATGIETLLADPEARRKMGAIGRQRYRRFDWSTLSEILLTTYRQVLEN